MKRRLPVALALLLTLTACGQTVGAAAPAAVPESAPTVPATAQATTAPETVPAEPERFVLSFAGDCTLGGSAANASALVGFLKTVGEDYGHPFRNVLDYFAADELTLVNLEGVLGSRGVPAQKSHVFRGPAEYVRILTEGSVEAVSLANNHTLDYGPSGYAETKRLLEEGGVAYVEKGGALLLTTPGGLRVGIYGASFYHGRGADLAAAFEGLRDQGAQVLIFFAHWGTEYAYTPDAEQRRVAHLAIDAGADIVVGSHPHVLQPVEKYGDGIIFYSLGNFSFGGNTSPRDDDTAVIQQEVLRHPGGAVTLGKTTYIPASISSDPDINNYQPTPYPEGSEGYDRVMRKLAGTWQP